LISDDEMPLSGGNVNAGVVRVGDTVRRAQGPHSQTVQQLLRHLEAKHFAHSPRFLGSDETGREILSFIPGSTDFPEMLWREPDAMDKAVGMLRHYHDATRDFDFGSPDDWARYEPDPLAREVICHNDFAPYNMVFRDGLPVGIIDFDLAGPGPRFRDLAYLAYWFVPLAFGAEDMADFARADLANGSKRLKRLCETYGTQDYAALLDQVSTVLDHMADAQSVAAMIGMEAANRLRDGGHFDHWQREAAAFEANKSQLLNALYSPAR
jgi:Phosphotransferase enzyme family